MKRIKIFYVIVIMMAMVFGVLMSPKAQDIEEVSTYYQGMEIELVPKEENYLYSLDGINFSPDVPMKRDVGTYLVYYYDQTVGMSSLKQKSVTIRKRDLLVIPNCLTYYGDAKEYYTGVSYSGFVGDDTVACITKKPIVKSVYKSTDPIGAYKATPEGGEAKNYNLIYRDDFLMVMPKKVTLQFESYTIGELDDIPVFKYNIVGEFINGDEQYLTIKLDKEYIGASEYEITAEMSEQCKNYELAVEKGSLNVLKQVFEEDVLEGHLKVTLEKGLAADAVMRVIPQAAKSYFGFNSEALNVYNLAFNCGEDDCVVSICQVELTLNEKFSQEDVKTFQVIGSEVNELQATKDGNKVSCRLVGELMIAYVTQGNFWTIFIIVMSILGAIGLFCLYWFVIRNFTSQKRIK